MKPTNNLHELLSPVAISNLKTMGIAAAVDKRQEIPAPYTIPDEAVRLCRARLILEEALETIRALGFDVEVDDEYVLPPDYYFQFTSNDHLNLLNIIDGVCDTVYVSIGTLCAAGVPDLPHLEIVNRANEAKFPDGKGLMGKDGKFLKPEGWQGPDHQKVMQGHQWADLRQVRDHILGRAYELAAE